jgi:uncharacterized membrane protein (DUF106 family)
MLRKTVENAALVIGFSLLFGIMLGGESFRSSIASAVNFIFAPLAEAIPFYMAIFVMATVTGLYAALIQKYTINWEMMRKVQGRLREFQKEYKEAMKTNNKYKLKKLEEERAEIMQIQGEVSKQQFKPMAYIAILSVPLFMWIYMYMGGHDFSIVVPFSGTIDLKTKIVGPIQWWFIWYFLASMPVSQMIRKVLDIGGA